MYRILTNRGIITTKHVRMVEAEFPGTSLFEKASSDETHKDRDQREGNYGYFDSKSDYEDLNLTYILFIPSHEPEPVVALDHDMHDDGPSVIPEPGQSPSTAVPPVDTTLHGYNLRSKANMAIPETISTKDEPCLRDALASSESGAWREAINQEFDTIVKAGTYVDVEDENVPCHPIPAGVILKLKRNQHGQPSRFKARLVACGNLQDVGNETYEKRTGMLL